MMKRGTELVISFLVDCSRDWDHSKILHLHAHHYTIFTPVCALSSYNLYIFLVPPVYF